MNFGSKTDSGWGTDKRARFFTGIFLHPSLGSRASIFAFFWLHIFGNILGFFGHLVLFCFVDSLVLAIPLL